MRGESHRQLGHYLARRYLDGVSRRHIQAFLLGCIQPDRNPATYLKGSFRHQWLRGHNYPNTHRFMCRISSRLERKEDWRLFDFYTLGKLVHYTADTFTYAHNQWFSSALKDHREYEEALQIFFLKYLQQDPQIGSLYTSNIMQSISHYHRKYRMTPPGVHTDSHFALTACSCILSILYVKM